MNVTSSSYVEVQIFRNINHLLLKPKLLTRQSIDLFDLSCYTSNSMLRHPLCRSESSVQCWIESPIFTTNTSVLHDKILEFNHQLNFIIVQ